MNALHAMDEMMSANDMNMNVAAITPAVILAYSGSQLFKFLYYALLKLGQSREEVYASFRKTLTDIERLLVMRDNPPLPPASLKVNQGAGENKVANNGASDRSELGPDDLGMLMLLVHECRTVMWKNRRRFSEGTIQSVSEDLSELTGERGKFAGHLCMFVLNNDQSCSEKDLTCVCLYMALMLAHFLYNSPGAVSIRQQLHIINRMCRTYPFLKVISTGHIFQSRRFRR